MILSESVYKKRKRNRRIVNLRCYQYLKIDPHNKLRKNNKKRHFQ